MLRGWVKRLQRRSEGDMVAIRQTDGTTKRFPRHELREAFIEDVDRTLGRVGSEVPTHPLITAIANSDDPTWARSFVGGGEGNPKAVEDLSEGP